MSDATRRGTSLRETHPGAGSGRASSEASMTDRDDTSRTDPGNRSAADIEREVEGTRARLTGTIEELRDRVAPGQIFEQGVDWLRGSGGSEFLGNLGRALRDNPMPVALIGAGIAWLALSGDQAEGRERRDHADRRVPLTYGADLPDRMPAAPMPRGGASQAEDWTVPPYYADDTGGSDQGGVERGSFDRGGQGLRGEAAGIPARPSGGLSGQPGGGALRGAAGSLGATARDAADRLSGAAHGATEAAARGWQSTTDAAGARWRDAADTASHVADQAADTGRAAARRAAELGEEARHGIGRMLEEQPLLLGALGLAIGAAVGALLPRSAAEDRLLGEARDDLAGRAAALADEAYAKARETAGEAVGHARDRLDEAGLSPEKGAETLGQVARDLRDVVSGTAGGQTGGGQTGGGQAGASDRRP